MAFKFPPEVYDPSRCRVMFGPVPLTGYAPGTFINARRDEPVWKQVKGTNGELRRIKQSVKSGVVELTLRHSVPTNRFLGVVLSVDETNSGGILPLVILDSRQGTLVSSTEAYIDRYPDLTYSGNEPDLRWTFVCNDLNIVYPGFSIESSLDRYARVEG